MAKVRSTIEQFVSLLYENNLIFNLNALQDPVDWIERVRVLKGVPFSFKDREYLKPILRDINKEIYIVKARQMEITELALNWLLFYLSKFPSTVGLYMTDRQDHVNLFSKTRLHSWGIDESEILKSLIVRNKGNVSWQPFKNGSELFMFSAWKDFEASRSIPADFVVIDEMQSVNVEALPVVKESMSKSPHRRILGIGTGSDEGDGWYDLYHMGNQNE